MFRVFSRLLRDSDLNVIDRNELTSTDGWTLRFLGNSPETWRLQDAEGNREVTIHVEGLSSGPQSVIWHADLSEVRGWQSGTFDPLTEEDRQRIARNLKRGMHALKHVCNVKQ